MVGKGGEGGVYLALHGHEEECGGMVANHYVIQILRR